MAEHGNRLLSFGWGYLLGPIILFLLILVFAPNSPSDDQVLNYIKESKQLTLSLDTAIYSKGGMWAQNLIDGDRKRFSHTARYFLNFRKNRYKDYGVFYSATYHKYFVIENYNGALTNIVTYDREKEIQGMINQAELNSSSYGSIQNPVPILWLTKGFDLSETQYAQAYRNNVTDYLRFYKNRKPYNKGACAICPY